MIPNLRACLEALAANADILPASGGAVQQLLQPDQEQREDEALSTDGVLDLFAETPAPRGMSAYIPCAPITREAEHRYRYFFDGALRTYYLCSASEHEVTEPVVLAEMGATCLHREYDGRLVAAGFSRKVALLTNLARFSGAVKLAVERSADGSGIEVIDTGSDPENLFGRRVADAALRCQGVARWHMRQLEIALLDEIQSDDWMIVDGSVAISTSRIRSLRSRKVMGVAKSFATTPKFKVGRGSTQIGVMRLLAELPVGHRTPVFTSVGGVVGFWYVRLWEQGAVDFPLMGVVKCDMVLPSDSRVFDADMVTALSRCLVAERCVTPYGKDARWHSHLYPIHICEQYIRTRFQSPVMQREWLAREWSRILRGTK